MQESAYSPPNLCEKIHEHAMKRLFCTYALGFDQISSTKPLSRCAYQPDETTSPFSLSTPDDCLTKPLYIVRIEYCIPHSARNERVITCRKEALHIRSEVVYGTRTKLHCVSSIAVYLVCVYLYVLYT
jgi:hypothetical protein